MEKPLDPRRYDSILNSLLSFPASLFPFSKQHSQKRNFGNFTVSFWAGQVENAVLLCQNNTEKIFGLPDLNNTLNKKTPEINFVSSDL
ncbi:MAG: hypothetical protein MI684_04125 [Chlorobiales bacterium]|nr:hypothetical protein [Chlorobiales bacterium]